MVRQLARVVVVNKPGQRVLHAAEGGGDLHQLPSLDGTTEKRGAATTKGNTTAA